MKFPLHAAVLICMLAACDPESSQMDDLLQRADQGEAAAQYRLSVIYATGDGLSQDDTESARWLQLAAAQGYADAQHNLGVLFILGQGVPQDYVLSHMWLNLAASRQDGEEADDSATARDSLAAKMTPEQIAESQALAREWKPKTWEELQPE